MVAHENKKCLFHQGNCEVDQEAPYSVAENILPASHPPEN